MSSGLDIFSTETLTTRHHQLGQDGKDGKTFLVKLKKKYMGEYSGNEITLKRGHPVAVKIFKKQKSVAKILKEAEYQNLCTGISPRIYGVNTSEKYIAMEALDSLPAQMYKNNTLPENIQYMICALMKRLDNVAVLHGDMNALNVMLDTNGRPYMIDFGFAKKINNKILKKHGNNPNFTVSLWGLVRGFKRYKVQCDIMSDCMEAARAGEDIDTFVARGETLMEEFKRPSKKRKR